MMESLYCTIFIVDVSQNPEEVDTVSSRIQQLIEDHGGIIKKVNPWGKQKLAYPIQNRTYGFYVEIEFTANSHFNIPKTIEQEYRLNDRVLRYLTYVVTKKELKQRAINEARMKERAPIKEDEIEPVASSIDIIEEANEFEEPTSLEEKPAIEEEDLEEDSMIENQEEKPEEEQKEEISEEQKEEVSEDKKEDSGV